MNWGPVVLLFLLQRDAVPAQITETEPDLHGTPLTQERWNITRLFLTRVQFRTCRFDHCWSTGLVVCVLFSFVFRFALFSQLKITTSQHVSSRAFNCCHNNSTRGHLRRAAHMASLPNEKEEAAFRSEGGRSCGSSVSCGKGVSSRGVSAHRNAFPGERVEGCRVSDHTTAAPADTVFWTAAWGETSDGELWGGVAAAVATDAEGAVCPTCAGAWLWMGKSHRRKKCLSHDFIYQEEK